jgi:hypothetical protein
MILGSDFSVSLYQAFTFFFNLDVAINCKVTANYVQGLDAGAFIAHPAWPICNLPQK